MHVPGVLRCEPNLFIVTPRPAHVVCTSYPVVHSPADLSSSTRICEAMLRIHEAGVEHGDMEYPDTNVVVNPDGDVRILDFEYAKFHKCARKRELPFVDGFPEDFFTYGCNEMWYVLNDLLWTPGEYLTSPVSSPSYLWCSQTTSISGVLLFL